MQARLLGGDPRDPTAGLTRVARLVTRSATYWTFGDGERFQWAAEVTQRLGFAVPKLLRVQPSRVARLARRRWTQVVLTSDGRLYVGGFRGLYASLRGES